MENNKSNIKYAHDRENREAVKYSLRRRTEEVMLVIDKYHLDDIKNIVDLGTADAKMLNQIQKKYDKAKCLGIEYDNDLVKYAKEQYPDLDIKTGDIQKLELSDEIYDVAIATAVIEHVPKPMDAFKEIKRILKPNGLIIITTPDPFWEAIATFVGYLDNHQHFEVMNLKKIEKILSEFNFTVCEMKKFMLLPVSFPFEYKIENCLRKFGLNCLMANQIIIGRK